MERPQRRPQQERGLDLKRYFMLIAKNWYWFLLSLGCALFLVKLINAISPKIYKISCDVVIGDDLNAPAVTMPVTGAIDFSQVNPINKEIGILKSRHLAEQTIKSLDFSVTYYELIKTFLIKRRRYEKTPFIVVPDSNAQNRPYYDINVKILGKGQVRIKINGDYDINRTLKFNEHFHSKAFSFIIKNNPTYPVTDDMIGNEYLVYFNTITKLTDEFTQNLNIIVDPTSQNILTLSLTGENIFQSIDYLHKFCQLYIQNDLDLRNQIANNTIKYIDNQLALLNQQLIKASDSLINYKRQHRIFEDQPSDDESDEFTQLDGQVQDMMLYKMGLESMLVRLDSIRNGNDFVIPSFLLDKDSRLQDGLEQINQLVTDREYLLKNQNANSPDVQKTNQKLKVEIKGLTAYSREELGMVNKRLEDLNKERETQETKLLNLPALQRQLAKLERDFELTENLYNLYQQKRIEANLAKASTVSKIRVLDPATVDRAELIKPKKSQNIQVAIIAGLLLPLIFLFGKDFLSNKILDIRDVNQLFKSPVVGKLLHSNGNDELPSIEFPWSGFTESLRTLHAKLDYILPPSELKIVSVTSAGSGEGKTFCALNLAAVIASSGKKVLLIGLDLRRPRLHEIFDVTKDIGLSNYLAEKNEMDELIIHTDVKNLDIICSGPVPPDPVELLSKTRMELLVRELKNQYDLILFDTAPIGLVADPLVLNKFTDITLFIIRIGYTNKNVLQFLHELEDNNALNRLCLVVNDLQQPERYGNGYYHSYYQKETPSRWKRKIRYRINK